MTVIHQSPFNDIEHYSNEAELEPEFIKKWCVPFYLSGLRKPIDLIENLAPLIPELDQTIVKKLLGDINWRTRITGAYFAAIMDLRSVEDIIGIHLLKSQVCNAGTGYCITLASFNTPNSIEYLKKYLTYYLTRKDLYFDQKDALSALYWTDKLNSTNEVEQYIELYYKWSSTTYPFDLESTFKLLEEQMNNLQMIKTFLARASGS